MTNFLNNLKTVNITNKSQKVGLRLLRAEGKWLSKAQLNVVGNDPTPFIRDLRKESYGSFQVECKSAAELNKRGGNNKFFYRIPTKSVTTTKLRTLFRF